MSRLTRGNAYRNGTYSAVALAILAVGGIAWYLIAGPGPAKQEEPTATETTVEDETQDSRTYNPFSESRQFIREDADNTKKAIIEIKTSPNGEYYIKESITGDIVSKGVWQYNHTTSRLTLTHIGDFPMSNVFRVVLPGEDDKTENIQLSADIFLSQLSAGKTSDTYKLIFMANESTNVRYDLLTDGDVFIEQDYPDINEKTKL